MTYRNGGEGDDRDPEDKNPTGRPRRSSAGKRRQKERKLYGGTPWGRKDDDKKKGK